jgi:hypothetical protein
MILHPLENQLVLELSCWKHLVASSKVVTGPIFIVDEQMWRT